MYVSILNCTLFLYMSAHGHICSISTEWLTQWMCYIYIYYNAIHSKRGLLTLSGFSAIISAVPCSVSVSVSLCGSDCLFSFGCRTSVLTFTWLRWICLAMGSHLTLLKEKTLASLDSCRELGRWGSKTFLFFPAWKIVCLCNNKRSPACLSVRMVWTRLVILNLGHGYRSLFTSNTIFKMYIMRSTAKRFF